MRLLHVITSLHTGGAEKLMLDLLPRLRESGLDVDLLLFDGTDTPFRRAAEQLGLKVYDLGKGGSVYSPIKFFKLLPYLRRYDIVHTHNTAPQLFAAFGSVLCSVVLCTTEHNTSNRRRGWKWYVPYDRWMYSRYERVICISQKTEESLRAFIHSSDSKISTIPNGIDVAHYAQSIPADLKKGGYGCKTAIVQVAGFRYQKDQDTVIRSLVLLPDSVHLYLVGDGSRKVELIALIEELNLQSRVHLLGVRTDVPQILSAADIVVMSSHWEGFGLAAVEGMASGKPVIASDVDGLREVVEGAGVLFPHGDHKALAAEIEYLETNLEYYNEIASRCRKRAYQFDIAEMVKGYSDVYKSLQNQ